MFQTKVMQKKKTHFMFKDFFENRVVYQIMWKNMAQGYRMLDN